MRPLVIEVKHIEPDNGHARQGDEREYPGLSFDPLRDPFRGPPHKDPEGVH
jgi:hypothetical protein